MRIAAYSGSMTETIEIDDELISCHLHPDDSIVKQNYDLEKIKHTIDNPIGKPPIESLVQTGSRVAIIVDDATRPTPTAIILPVVLKKLYTVGVRKEDITITVGTGLHRDTTVEEKRRIVGPEIFDDFDVVDNAGRVEDQYETVGMLSNGMKVNINKRVAAADLVITIGLVKSHAFAGFTGGAKSILPAVSNQESIHGNHTFDNVEYPKGILGSADKSYARKYMEEAARFVDPFIINVVLDKDANILHMAAGDVVAAHRDAVAFYMKESSRLVEAPVPIAVLYGGLAGSINLYQALFGCNVVKTTERPIILDGGIIIMFAECAQGLGTPLFEELMPLFKTPQEGLDYLKSRPVVDDQWAVQFLCSFLKDVDIYIVSTHISKDIASQLKLKKFESLQDACDHAIAKYDNPKIAIVENPDGLITNVKD